MKRCFVFAVVVLFLPQGVWAEMIGTLDDLSLGYSDNTRTASVEAYVQLTGASALSVDGWEAYVNLTGPNSKVRITGFGQTSVHASLFSGSTPGGVCNSSYVDASDFTMSSAIPVLNGAGLVKIGLEILGGAVGDYALSFDGANSFLSQDIMGGDHTWFDGFSGGSIVVVPEASTLVLSGIAVLAILAWRCWRRQTRATAV